MFKSLNKEKKGMFFTTFNNLTKIKNKKEKRFTGEFEGNLLCEDCDNKLLGSIYEAYGHKVLYDLKQLPKDERPIFTAGKSLDGLGFIHCSNLNYQKFKLFLLSILWRASISSRPFFNEIHLEHHEDILRKMIYSGDAGKVSDYPIFIATYANDKNSPKELIAKPQKNFKDGKTSVVFMMDGAFYIFYISCEEKEIPNYVLSETIKLSNEMNMVVFPTGTSRDKVLGFAGLI